ncbi:hypothetical protein [Georgenia faecalis]|uniref:ATP synthase protein I n=1 Tax=Georgenia faecalis TaxID=2483799 RepID=A0ABV9DDL0_9MICO|nr:hypothetical protein [Georgenia faecalis]
MTESDTTRATRAMFRTILRRLTALVVVLAVGGALIGGVLTGMPGVWGALMAAGIAALFTLGTALTMLLTADKPIYVASGAGVGAWLVKTVVVIIVLVLVRDRDFYSPGVFFCVLVVALLGSLAIEFSAMLKARIPNVEPGADPWTGAGPTDGPR